MTRTIKERPKLGVSIEQGDDGGYRLVIDGEVTYTTRVLAAVEAEYDDVIHERTAASRELRARESAHYTMQAVRSDAFDRRAANRRKTGGKGGRGGV